MSINRRDYLKKMAAATVALGAARLDVIGQSPRQKRGSRQTSQAAAVQSVDFLAENFQTWPKADARPAHPTIKMYFKGLLDFYYNPVSSDHGFCGVGFIGGHHEPTIRITENGHAWLGPMPIDKDEKATFGIVNGAHQLQPADARFLKDDSANDFRWLIDMQAASWYPGTSFKDKPDYGAKLFIRNGTFFTNNRTRYKLLQSLRVEQSNVSYLPGGDLGHPAEVMGCEIQLGANESVSLMVNGQQKYMENNGKEYVVTFSNECKNMGHGECTFSWDHFQEIKRNDFHHHRDALKPTFPHKLSVVLGEPPAAEPVIGQLKKKRIQEDADTAAAPCMGAGYGGGPGPA
jgi:hypothetical protein